MRIPCLRRGDLNPGMRGSGDAIKPSEDLPGVLQLVRLALTQLYLTEFHDDSAVGDHIVEGTFAAAQVVVTIEGVVDLFEGLKSCGGVSGSSGALLPLCGCLQRP